MKCPATHDRHGQCWHAAGHLGLHLSDGTRWGSLCSAAHPATGARCQLPAAHDGSHQGQTWVEWPAETPAPTLFDEVAS